MIIPDTYTVESVTNGHPDKICDQVSDAVLDVCLSQDPKSRVAIECLGAHGMMLVAGEVTTNAVFNAPSIARKTYRRIGYNGKIKISSNIVQQSPDISQGVDTGGAGDQGIMYGYATNETDQYLPKAVVLVHKLTKGLEEMRKSGKHNWLGPDGKAQVTMTKGTVETILVSCQHTDNIELKEIRSIINEELVGPILENGKVNILVNPTGKFVSGGFEADTGLTGRKIMVDTYGGLIPHGGGCFSGKDPSKVDRSGAYMARYVAKNIVASGISEECLVSVSYAIGVEKPLMISAVGEEKDLSRYAKEYDFRPNAIIERLKLRSPLYTETATYGHFGKPGLPWEDVLD